MSGSGQERRIEVVGDESGLPPIAAVPLHCGEPTFWANSGREQLQQIRALCGLFHPREPWNGVQSFSQSRPHAIGADNQTPW
jgi:hypothetical protein